MNKGKPIRYKFNNGRGAVLCRKCSVILEEGLSEEEGAERWAGKDICEKCMLTDNSRK